MGVLHCKMRAILVLILDFTTAFWTVCVYVCVCVSVGWGSCIAVSGASTLRDVNFVIRSGQLSGCCVMYTLNALLKFMEIIVVKFIFGNDGIGWDGWVWIGLWNWNVGYEKLNSVNFLCENNVIIELIRSPLFSLFWTVETVKYYLDWW